MNSSTDQFMRLVQALAELAAQENRLAGLGELAELAAVQVRIEAVQNSLLRQSSPHDGSALLAPIIELRRQTQCSLQGQSQRLRAEHGDLIRRRGRVRALRPVYTHGAQNGLPQNLNVAA